MSNNPKPSPGVNPINKRKLTEASLCSKEPHAAFGFVFGSDRIQDCKNKIKMMLFKIRSIILIKTKCVFFL